MLHRNVLMADIDVDQWRNAQALLLRSAKAAQRVICIHEGGEVRKLVHTGGLPVAGAVESVADPVAVAKSLWEANSEHADFVAVFERAAFDAYFAQIQDAWDIDDDLDVFVQRTYEALDDYPQGIVTYPYPARTTLGLQWRLGASHEELTQAVRSHVDPGTTVILAVHREGAMWSSLVLDFDQAWSVTSITTADPSLVELQGERSEILQRLVAHVESTGKTVAVAMSMDYDTATALLAAAMSDKAGLLTAALAAGSASVLRPTKAAV